MLTADFFNLVENNVLTADPNHSAFDVQTGQQRTRGFEFEGLGRLPGHVDFIASYTYQDPRITRTTEAAQLGQRPVAVPSHMASLFLKRDFQMEPSWSAGLAGGLSYTDNTAEKFHSNFTLTSKFGGELIQPID